MDYIQNFFRCIFYTGNNNMSWNDNFRRVSNSYIMLWLQKVFWWMIDKYWSVISNTLWYISRTFNYMDYIQNRNIPFIGLFTRGNDFIMVDYRMYFTFCLMDEFYNKICSNNTAVCDWFEVELNMSKPCNCTFYIAIYRQLNETFW